jgi:hypothetical protein
MPAAKALRRCLDGRMATYFSSEEVLAGMDGWNAYTFLQRRDKR